MRKSPATGLKIKIHQNRKGEEEKSDPQLATERKKIGYPAPGKTIPESKADFFVTALLDRHTLPIIFIV
jgi:hypothetical protein